MLIELDIKSFGIIENLRWQLSDGLNVVTGDTGAGKSMVIDALESLLDGKLNESSIRFEADMARLEAIFTLTQAEQTESALALLAAKGLTADDNNFLLSCELRRAGRTISRVNGDATTRGIIKELGRMWVDIHGQSQHLSLYYPEKHLAYLDEFGHITPAREKFALKLKDLYALRQNLTALDEKLLQRNQRVDLLRFQVNEIEQAALKEDEEETLESRRLVLAFSEKLRDLALEVIGNLGGIDDTNNPLATATGGSLKAMRRLSAIDTQQGEMLRELESAFESLEDIVRRLRTYADNIECDTLELNRIEERMGVIRQLKRKYGDSVGHILEYLQRAGTELAAIDNWEAERQRLVTEETDLKTELGSLAESLSTRRSQAAGDLAHAVEGELSELGMAQVRFGINISRTEESQGLPAGDGKTYTLNPNGIDQVEFVVSTNPGEPVKPLAAIASTGEISRFILALKSALAKADRTPVLIFDEIDIGVGGRSGEIIGRKLWKLARDHQVICITHLPQIACYADSHVSVSKQKVGSRIESVLKQLQGDARYQELASMLGSGTNNVTKRQMVDDMLREADAWKKANRGL